MASISPLLTIAIPTYNRAKFLERCLNSIVDQIKGQESLIELIVSDNCSTDNTHEVIERIILKGIPIQYIKNVENKGADFNIAQCYIMAQGKYVVAFGDDDIIVKGGLQKILEILSSGDYGVVHLKNSVIGKTVYEYDKTSSINYTIYDNSSKFLKKVNYYVSFISGNVVNRKYFDEKILTPYYGTYLIQVPYILESILSAKQNIYVDDILLLAEPDNSGGYNLFEVFGPNFINILEDVEVRFKRNEIKDIIVKELILTFFPVWIIRIKTENFKFERINPITLLKPSYKSYFYFWLVCYPISCLPHKLAIVYRHFVTLFVRLRLKI